jgi:hypothetical protein
MKQETLEEAAEIILFDNTGMLVENHPTIKQSMLDLAKWQQERMYSEEEVLNFTQTIIMQYKFGNTNIEQLDLLKETLQLFKNK